MSIQSQLGFRLGDSVMARRTCPGWCDTTNRLPESEVSWQGSVSQANGLRDTNISLARHMVRGPISLFSLFIRREERDFSLEGNMCLGMGIGDVACRVSALNSQSRARGSSGTAKLRARVRDCRIHIPLKAVARGP